MIHATPGIMTGVAEGVGDMMITAAVAAAAVVVAAADGTGTMTVVGLGTMTGETGTEIGEIDMGVGMAETMRGGSMGGGIKGS
jgi:hypothetical protein